MLNNTSQSAGRNSIQQKGRAAAKSKFVFLARRSKKHPNAEFWFQDFPKMSNNLPILSRLQKDKTYTKMND